MVQVLYKQFQNNTYKQKYSSSSLSLLQVSAPVLMPIHAYPQGSNQDPNGQDQSFYFRILI